MKPIPECVPDIMNMVLDAASRATSEPFIHRKVLARVMTALASDGDFGSDANDLVQRAIETAYKTLGVRDPYEKEKARRNRAMRGLDKEIAAYLDGMPDRVAAAVMISWAAAQVDLDVLGREEARATTFNRLRASPPHPDERADLAEAVVKAERVWIVAGDAGEIVADRCLAAELRAIGKQVTMVVASRPVLAMATPEDAETAECRAVAEVIDPGAGMFGLSLDKATGAFRERFAAADLVIAKGAAHFAALREGGREFFSLMRADCPHEAACWGVPPGSGVLAKWTPERTSGQASKKA